MQFLTSVQNFMGQLTPWPSLPDPLFRTVSSCWWRFYETLPRVSYCTVCRRQSDSYSPAYRKNLCIWEAETLPEARPISGVIDIGSGPYRVGQAMADTPAFHW